MAAVPVAAITLVAGLLATLAFQAPAPGVAPGPNPAPGLEPAPSPVAGTCPEPSATLLMHSCWGEAEADLLLLPEDGVPSPDPRAVREVLITGVYTGRDRRAGDRPNPVGLFVHGGRVINPTLAPMDGILLIAGDRPPRLQHRARVRLGSERYNLSDPGMRQRFAEAAARAAVAVAQSHLLVIDGRADVSPVADAPRFVRRILFSRGGEWGLYRTPGAMTLFEATAALVAAHAPDMALNLDMGSYDYCRLTREGRTRNCGYRGLEETGLLSNLLRLRLE